MFRWQCLAISLLIFGNAAHAQFIPTVCPDRILKTAPEAACVVRNAFTFLIFGSVKVESPSAACKVAEKYFTSSSNSPTTCHYAADSKSCFCADNGVTDNGNLVQVDPVSEQPPCPAKHDVLPERAIVVAAEGFKHSMPICLPRDVCPVPPLTPITDPVAQEHESRAHADTPDMARTSEAVQTGAACITRMVSQATVTSGFRPQAYQDHMRETWDKWILLKKITSEACKLIKADVAAHIKRHKMRVRPGVTSNHTPGNAVDIQGVPESDATQLAKNCNMFRPYLNDPVHFQPIVKKPTQ